MATNKKRKNRGKGAGAIERRRRMRQQADEIRARRRDAHNHVSMLDAYGLLGMATMAAIASRKVK